MLMTVNTGQAHALSEILRRFVDINICKQDVFMLYRLRKGDDQMWLMLYDYPDGAYLSFL